MGLAQLARTVGTDPVIAEAIETARAGTGGVLDLSAPAGLRPFVAALLAADPATGGAGRTVLIVTAADHEASALETMLAELLGRFGRGLPAVGDAAPRAALAPV